MSKAFIACCTRDWKCLGEGILHAMNAFLIGKSGQENNPETIKGY